LSIRFKVVLPYLFLTLVVAVMGVYVVTRLVSSSQSERLKNQLLEAGRVVSDSLARQEIQHVENARLIAYTNGLAQALEAGNRESLTALAKPMASGKSIENLIVIDENGQEQIHLLRQADGNYTEIKDQTGAGSLGIVQLLLLGNADNTLPRRGLGINPIDQRYYYFTTIVVPFEGKVAGVVMVGTSIDTILPMLKSTSLADIIIYTDTGKPVASTLAGQISDPGELEKLAILPADYAEILMASDVVYGQTLVFNGRDYSIARGPLLVGNDRLGVFGVALPADFVVESGTTTRDTYVLLFGLLMLAVVLLGYRISRLIVNPLNSLLRASQAIAGGDLNQRTGIRSSDEIGELASTFDEMSQRLQERTNELEKTYHILQQMDQTKVTFIEVAAHELRTPLTLVKGYTQMLAMKFKDEPEMMALTQGILDGSERMQEIVGSMLDVSRIDSKILKILPEDTNLGVVLARVYKVFRDALQERNLSLGIQGVDGLPIIQADPDQLYKVFYHLVINAIKYTPDGGRITIHGHLVDAGDGRNEVEIVVSDTGIGIDPAHHELIFEKFYQTGEVYMHSSGKTKFKGGGPGLGLAIARGIVAAHQGRIWVESPGHDETNLPGSKFFVRLPVKAEENEPIQEPES
jgi:signal transduction histidine kinase